jgi:hypothetical protein
MNWMTPPRLPYYPSPHLSFLRRMKAKTWPYTQALWVNVDSDGRHPRSPPITEEPYHQARLMCPDLSLHTVSWHMYMTEYMSYFHMKGQRDKKIV